MNIYSLHLCESYKKERQTLIIFIITKDIAVCKFSWDTLYNYTVTKIGRLQIIDLRNIVGTLISSNIE